MNSLIARRRLLVGLSAWLLASCGGGGYGGGGGTSSPPSALSYSQPPAYTVGTAISPLTPTVSGTVSSYSVSPALPAGLSLSTTSGTISGTPTAVTAQATYTVTASNAYGSTTATLAITVNPGAPAFSYSASSLTLSTGVVAQGITPTSTGGAVASWSISPATLPAGLSFSTSSGAITGTPTALAAGTTYMVTAQNSSGKTTESLTLTVQTVLLDLGHSQALSVLRETSTRVLSLDKANVWALWDYSSAAKLAGSVAVCKSTECVAGKLPAADLEGSTVADESAAGLEVRAASDGSLLGVINAPLAWWKIASDGSYVCGGSASGLTVWMTSGAVITSRTGDYSSAVAYAAPGQVQVAGGPAGVNKIETIPATSTGSSTVSAAFLGTFSSWFLDGQHFLTSTGTTVWAYDKSATTSTIQSVPTVINLAGLGNWFWVGPSAGTLNIYPVTGSTTASYSFSNMTVSVIPSGTTLGVIAFGTSASSVSVIDLSGSNPVKTDYTPPIAYGSAYGAVSPSQWLLGNRWGAVVDGASLGGTARYFGFGAAWSIAGSTPRVAVATASGAILYFDAGTLAKEGSIGDFASQVDLSSDGTVLAVAGDQLDAQYHSDQSVRTYSLPAATLINTWPYTDSSPPVTGEVIPQEIALSASGTALAQQTVIYPASCASQVTAVTGGAASFSNSACIGNVYLSPSGTELAFSEGGILLGNPPPTTQIYNNGALVTAVAGWVLGWLDEGRLLVEQFAMQGGQVVYAGSVIYSNTGSTLVANVPLPQLVSLQVVEANSIYDQNTNKIYSTVTGKATFSSTSPTQGYGSVAGVGAVAGTNVVFASGSQILVQPY
jgi:putative Ig domain-containing protein